MPFAHMISIFIVNTCACVSAFLYICCLVFFFLCYLNLPRCVSFSCMLAVCRYFTLLLCRFENYLLFMSFHELFGMYNFIEFILLSFIFDAMRNGWKSDRHIAAIKNVEDWQSACVWCNSVRAVCVCVLTKVHTNLEHVLVRVIQFEWYFNQVSAHSKPSLTQTFKKNSINI